MFPGLMKSVLQQIARFRVFESGTTPSFLSQEATQGSVTQSFPGRLFPLEYCPSLSLCSYRFFGPPFVSIGGDPKSIIAGFFVH